MNAPTDTPISRTAQRAYACALVLLIAGFWFRPGVRPLVAAMVGLLGVAGVVYGAVSQRSPRLGAWLMLAVAIVVLSTGDVIYGLAAVPVGYPSAPDLFYLAACLPLTLGLLWLGRPRVASMDWPMILDTAALSLAGALVVWIVLVRPGIVSMHLTGAGKVTAVASWVAYVAVLAACVRVVLAWRTNPALAILCTGVVGFLVAEFLYGLALLNGTGRYAGPVDLGFLVFGGLCGLAALTRSMTSVASAPYARHQLGPWRLAMLAVALLVAPTALLVQATAGPVTTGVAIAVVAAAVGVMLLVRLAMTARAYRSRAAREHATRVASRALVTATTGAEVEAGLTAALASMVPAGVPARTRVFDQGQQVSTRDSPDQSTVDPKVAAGGRGELRIPVDPGPRGNRVIAYTAPWTYLAELGTVLEALAEQAGSALTRIDLIASLRAEERERYFRTLVHTSTDVILISRRGRIEYATPSAEAMFGWDIRGAAFEDVVEPVRGGEDGPRPWSVVEDGTEGQVRRPDGTTVTVLVHRRDLTGDPTVGGVVSTLRDVTEERDLRRSLAYRASHDSLTGLANAELLREQLRHDRQTAGRNGLSVVLFVDLDDFKAVNDTYGHEVGDGLLITVARRVRSCLRSDDVAARLGGDEFAVLLRDVPDAMAAHAAAQRIADTLSRPANVAGVMVECQASIGLAIARTPAEFDSLLRRADTALYTAKADGKGLWRQYSEGMISPVRRRTDLREELERAIREDLLTLHYQPIVDLATGRAEGFEALIRFHHTAATTMPPDELIAIAEDNALIISLGDWILRRALADLTLLNLAQPTTPRYVSVNVSARQLRQPGFAATVRGHLAAAGVQASSLVLEITENVLLTEDERAWSRLAELRRDGVRVAIDDYGTGYASLSYLRQPAIDIVKIDRSFLYDLSSHRTQVLLEAVIRTSTRLGLAPVAEGVEDDYARDVLLSLGCRYGQGFRYAPAMPPDQAHLWGPRVEPG